MHALFSPRLFPLLLTLILDQASKLYLLFGYNLPVKAPVDFMPSIELTVVWNYGISYGLFQQDSTLGKIILLGFTLAAIIFLSMWLIKAADKLTQVALGLIIGGAIGNAIDRLAYGAVFDFIHFYLGSFSWYVFNIADAAIVVGAALMLYEAFFTPQPPKTSAVEKP